jgi:IS1 family transposase
MLDSKHKVHYTMSMNKSSHEKRVQILNLLVEGNSMRATARLADVAFNTVSKLFIETAKVCLDYQDKAFVNLTCKRLQLDEIWSFVYAKAKNVPEGKQGQAGDVWTWVAIDADSKLVPSWRIGPRDSVIAGEFVKDLAGRLANRVQITADGFKPYLVAVDDAFGSEVDFAQLIKIYGETSSEGQRRYSPAFCIGAKKAKVIGSPDMCCVSTSFVERQNLTMRMSIRRFTRLTNAFSKKIENHAHSVALHYMHYNFVRVHKSLRVTPAMAAGITDHVWELGEIVTLLEAREAASV